MMEQFLEFSAEMTAFPVFALQGTGLAEAYLKTATSVVGSRLVGELLNTYLALDPKKSREQQLRQLILGDEKLGPIARNIIKLWYIGIWEPLPQAWLAKYGPVESNIGFTVSPAAYTEGLLWPAIGANPPGAKAPGYGSWVTPPQFAIV